MAKRRKYTPEYRREAAALVLDTDRPIAHVAEEIDVGAQLLGRWVQQERERRDPPAGPGAPLAAEEREELKQLRRRVYDLERDNEFLGKAAAFFASKPPGRNGSSCWTRRRRTTRSPAWPGCW